jgi:hypothetical protein
MIEREQRIELEEGDVIEVEDDWNLDFEDDRPMDQFLSLKQIDTALCDTADLVKTKCGRFIIFWNEQHPELGSYADYFGVDDRLKFDCREHSAESKLAETRMAEWNELRARLRPEEFYEEISRQEAYRIIAYFWLPEEFHSDAGIL